MERERTHSTFMMDNIATYFAAKQHLNIINVPEIWLDVRVEK